MQATTLAATPELYKDYIKVIESSFHYQDSNHFDVDFYPLMKEANWHNCYCIVDQNQVVATIACLPREIIIHQKKFQILLIGGISVKEQNRGQGLFSKLFNLVLSLYKNATFHLLWSDKLDLYKKYSFHPCFQIYHYKASKSSDSSFKVISNTNLIKDIDQNLDEIRLKRDESYWNDISKITSTNLFIKETNGIIKNYFFKDKGQDLKGTIHEYGHIDSQELASMLCHADVWTPHLFEGFENRLIYGALLRVGNKELFSNFIESYTNNLIDVKNITEKNVTFIFNHQEHKIFQQDFLTGILGPNRFQELEKIKPIFITGLDSI